jgi:Ca-activated chloride channel homolog
MKTLKSIIERIAKTSLFLGFLFLLSPAVLAQITVKGTVTDESGNALQGVTVLEKGTSNGIVTGINGTYSILVKGSESILIFSYVGYDSREMKVGGRTVIDLSLTPSIVELHEMVVIGYGTRKKLERSGSISHPASNHSGLPMYTMADQSQVQQLYNPSIEEYARVNENGFRLTTASPLSTFSIDVDRASYSNVRRFLNMGQLPPADAVRIEEMINYFHYDYPGPTGKDPYSIHTTYTTCPWQSKHRLLHVGLQGKQIPSDLLPASNLVFLIDVSGSMNAPNRLPLLVSSFKLLVNNLRQKDRVAIVVYSGAAGLVLPSTSGENKMAILEALDKLQAGGSTAGSAGIKLAYKIAQDHFIDGGNNRVILASDGDFNVGVSNANELEELITQKRKTGVYLTVLGYGMGNYKDQKMETLANKGNGNYAYINDIQEANKVLVSEFGGTLFTIAKDVKIQVEFNPAQVQAYRLVGYENRMLNAEDFKDDTKDAGEMGAGHTVTAIYEIIPAGIESEFVRDVDPLKYKKSNATGTDEEVATVKTRYKDPNGSVSREINLPVREQVTQMEKVPENVLFSSSVAMFGMLLRNSEFKGIATYQDVIRLAEKSRGKDKDGYRAEFIRLAKTADQLILGMK